MENFEIKRYISELNSSVFFCHNHYTSLIDSPTGSGKTELIFERSLDTPKIIIAFPYTSQVIQQQKLHIDYQCLYDDNQYDDSKSNKIICTYDKLVTLINHDLDLNEYELHLDECHNLYVSSNYRDRIMYYISLSIRNRNYKKVFLYSSTYDTKYLNNYLIIDKHFKITCKDKNKDDITCIHLDNSSKVTMNESILYHFQYNVMNNEKVLIYRNNKSENISLGKSLEDIGFDVLVVDSDSKNEEEIIDLLRNQEISNKTNVLITTSILTEGINLLNKNITQIHYIDKSKSASTIRQFTSRARNRKHKTFVWYKKEENFNIKKNIFEEWYDFNENAKSLEQNYNYIVQTTESKLRNKHINHILKASTFYDRSWRQFGYRNVNSSIKIDYTRIANYFYELDVSNQSHNSYILGEELEKHNFDVHYMNYEILIDKNDQLNSKMNSRTVKEERKADKILILQGYIDENTNVKKRLIELLRKKNKDSLENREIKIAREWIQLEKNNVSKQDILEIIKNNNSHKAKYRLSLKYQMQNDLLYNELVNLVEVNKRYGVEERSDLLLQADKNILSKHKIDLNIKKMSDGSVHGKTSKGIFSNLFNLNTHVYNGKHTISIKDLDPLFFQTTN